MPVTKAVTWANVQGKPTTVGGYGITDLTWGNVQGKPTTVGGYGITDLTWGNVQGKPTTVGGYGITDLNWANVQGKPTTVGGLGLSDFDASAIAAQANASTGAVGTYALMMESLNGGVNRTPGSTIAGSSLTYSNATGASTTAPAGTWRCMGYYPSNATNTQRITVWARIA